MTEQRVTVMITDGVADVRLNRPEKRNALDNAMFAGLITAGERLKTEPGVRAVVLSGEGPDFCAGLDFGAFQAMRDGERLSLRPTYSPQGAPGHWPARRTFSRTARPGHRGGDWQRLLVGCKSRSAPISASSRRTRDARRQIRWGLIPDMTGAAPARAGRPGWPG